MSKMSELHMELSEQASELGFESLGEAEQAGYGVDWEHAKLIEPQEEAHKAWLKEKGIVLNNLRELHASLAEGGFKEWDSIVSKAIDFINEGEH